MSRVFVGLGVIVALAVGCGKSDVDSNLQATPEKSPPLSSTVPPVPRFPAGLPAKQVDEWNELNPSCRGTSTKDVRPCMQSFVDYGSILGLVTLLDSKDLGVHIDAVGHYKSNTIFQVTSIAKPFVAVAIMKLVEQGRIPSVESRVADLSGFGTFPYPDVTIKQLLTHTAGVWYWREPSPGVRTGIAPHLTNKLDNEPGITVRDKPLEFVASHYANPVLYPLGSTAPQYSNIGYTMLGWIVERVSGQPYAQFIKSEILDPLGMSDSFFFPDEMSASQRARIAVLDRRLPDPLEYAHYDEVRPGWVYPSPEGGLYSTAHDLQQFLRLFRHRGQLPGHARLLTEASIARLMDDQTASLDYSETEGVACPGQLGHSLGFFVVRAPGCVDWPGLSGGTIQHDGRFSTDLWYDPRRDQIGVFLYQIVKNGGTTPSLAENDVFKYMLERINRQ